MELVEGESLAERLTRGALPTDQVLRYGVEIADALEAAHKHGIVHRDLKPGNVMLTKAGVKLLDFGLAKHRAAAAQGEIEALTSLATEMSPSQPLTAQGTIMGTFQYMAPEQLEGEETDERGDIFALGCVLYEMATGKKAFTGKSRASLIGAILNQEPPPISSVEAMTPPALDRLVSTCLAKDPDDRFQTAHDVKLQLQWIAEGGSQVGAPAVVSARRKSREKLLLALSVFLLLVSGVLGVGFILRAPNTPRIMQSSIVLPTGFTIDGINDSLALSPDGKTLAVAAKDPKGTQRIYLRALDGPAPRALDRTKGATYPTWSPDGRWLAFFADGELEKVNIASGAVQKLADAPQGRGIAWGPNGTIVYAPNISSPLWRVSAGGSGALAIEKSLSAGLSHRDPRFLPDGKSILFLSEPSAGGSAKSTSQGLFALNLATGKSKQLLSDRTEGRYVPPGYLAFVRDGNLMVQRFDPKSLKLSGEALSLAQNISFYPARGTAQYSFAGSDFFVYQSNTAATLSQLTWFDPSGKERGTVGKPIEIASYNYFPLTISPDGSRAIATVGDSHGARLWMIDLTTGVASPFTFGKGLVLGAVWSPDGSRIVYAAVPGEGAQSTGPESLLVKKADGGSPPQKIATLNTSWEAPPTSWSPDGSVVAYSIQSGETNSFDIGILSMSGDHKVKLLVHGPANEELGAFSPDGKWLAYLSDESGSLQLYVIPYPGPGGKWQVTSNGSEGFAWASDHEIDTFSPNGKLYAIELETGAHGGLEIGSRRLLASSHPRFTVAAYSRALKRWLFAIPEGGGHEPPITLVTHWTKLLKSQ